MPSVVGAALGKQGSGRRRGVPFDHFSPVIDTEKRHPGVENMVNLHDYGACLVCMRS